MSHAGSSYLAYAPAAVHAVLMKPDAISLSTTGANCGMSTLLFKLLWPEATVVSLEPDPSNFDMLQRNTAG